MDIKDEIDEYLENTFSPEAQEEFNASLMVFEAFGYTAHVNDLTDLMFDPASENSDILQQNFIDCFHTHLNALLTLHQVTLMEESSFHEKNQVLSVLYRLQHLEDPVPVLRILESSLSQEEQFSKIVAAYSLLDETQVMTVFKEAEETFFTALQTYLYAQEETLANRDSGSDEVVQMQSTLVANLKDFFHVHGTTNLGYDMTQNGIQIGHDFGIYLNYIHDFIVTDDDTQTAKNILSVFFLAPDTFRDTLKMYRKFSEQLITGTERIMNIETKITTLLNDLRQFQKAKDVARSVSVVQHQA